MAAELPDWVQYIAGGIGVTLAVLAARLGWTGAPKQTPAAEIAGAIVDNRSAKEITDAIHKATSKWVDMHEELIEMRRDELETRRNLSNNIKTLHEEVRQLTRELISAASHRT